MAVSHGVVIELGRRLVPHVEQRRLLEDVEGEEPEGRGQHRGVDRATQRRDRLRHEIEEGGPDANAGSQRNDQADPARRSHGDDPAAEGRQEGTGADDDRGQGHEMDGRLLMRRSIIWAGRARQECIGHRSSGRRRRACVLRSPANGDAPRDAECSAGPRRGTWRARPDREAPHPFRILRSPLARYRSHSRPPPTRSALEGRRQRCATAHDGRLAR